MRGFKAVFLLVSLHVWGSHAFNYSSEVGVAVPSPMMVQNSSTESQPKGVDFSDDEQAPAPTEENQVIPDAPTEDISEFRLGDRFGALQPEICPLDNNFNFVVRNENKLYACRVDIAGLIATFYDH